ncbi:MAG TPA: hypothetical protein GXX33_05490 [Firmicutes bacterium]|uniref:RCK C-terminal domain-containing protein n=1 Tax=Capillibacterium thermochitinicola TaxID=2699427 RepID=A0A8J6HZQ9_9FIRM|nr:hypothetical protein [Capillibacterium thermochitinicola]HHW12438.1 hypothetical protein [Bacillota bacterium]
MKNAVLFYLLVLLWTSGAYDHFKRLCQEQGTAGAAAFVYRLFFRDYPVTASFTGCQNRQIIKTAFLVKAGELLCLVLLLRIFWVTWWGELILLLLLLGAGAFALYQLATLCSRTGEIKCVYPLTDGYGVYEIVLRPSGPVREWVGTTLAELDLRRKELLVLSITRAGKVIIFPKGPEVLLADDRLLVFGKTATLPAVPLGGLGPDAE